MIYLYDFIFVIVYLAIKDLQDWICIKEPDLYKIITPYADWFMFSFICLSMYFNPVHNLNEASVAFFICLATKGVHDGLKNYSINNKK